MNIILIGFMGTGKSEVGRLIADELGMSYIDTDAMIEKKEGRSINDIFVQSGEESFRDMESSLLLEIAGSDGNVISTGGGIVLRPDNIKRLKSMGPLVLLWAPPKTVHERLKKTSDRPLLNVPDPLKKIKEILDFRTPIYKNIADLEVNTTRLSPAEACNKIIQFVKKGK